MDISGTTQQRPSTWNDALAEYAQAQRAASRSPGTIRLHRHYLESLAARHRSPWAVTTQQLVAFMATEHWKPETRKSARACVCGFYRWAFGMAYLDDDLTLRVPTVKVPPGVPRPAPEHVVRQVLRDESERIIFMSLLAAELGMRASEIARVHADDYDAYGFGLLVHGKGGRTRLLPVVSERLGDKLAAVSAWAFPNGRGSHLTPGHVTKLLSKALPLTYTGHQMRHRCATVQYGATRDLLAVGAFLGHTRPETTQRYVLMPDDSLRRVANASALA